MLCGLKIHLIVKNTKLSLIITQIDHQYSACIQQLIPVTYVKGLWILRSALSAVTWYVTALLHPTSVLPTPLSSKQEWTPAVCLTNVYALTPLVLFSWSVVKVYSPSLITEATASLGGAAPITALKVMM